MSWGAGSLRRLASLAPISYAAFAAWMPVPAPLAANPRSIVATHVHSHAASTSAPSAAAIEAPVEMAAMNAAPAAAVTYELKAPTVSEVENAIVRITTLAWNLASLRSLVEESCATYPSYHNEIQRSSASATCRPARPYRPCVAQRRSRERPGQGQGCCRVAVGCDLCKLRGNMNIVIPENSVTPPSHVRFRPEAVNRPTLDKST